MKLTDKVGYFRRFETFATNRMVPSAVLEREGLAYWRVRILFAIIFTGVLLCLFGFAPLITFVIKEKQWGLLIFDVAMWSIGVSLLLSSRIRYEIRAIITLSMFYLAGLGIIIFIGPLGVGPGWLFAFAILVGVLMGLKPAIMALTVNGWLLAFVSTIAVEKESVSFVLAAILPHGIIEIPALILGEAAALGFGAILFLSLFKKERRGLLIPSLKQNLKYLMIAVALLLPAALIETYITPLFLR